MKRSALFLDRDGVINIDRGYVYQREHFDFIDGIFDLCRAAQNKYLKIIVVTNQAGIARGFYTERDFVTLTEWMVGVFKSTGITISDVYFCPYHPEHGIRHYKQDAECRKPKPGMIFQAASEHGLKLGSSFLIGDKMSDIEAGLAAGVGNNFLFSNSGGYNLFDVPTLSSLKEAMPIIEQAYCRVDQDSIDS